MQSLKELRAENAKADEAELDATPQVEEDEVIEEEAAEVVEEESEDLAESDEETETETEVEGWMQSEAEDSQESDASDDIPPAAWGAARKHYQAKSAKKDEAHNEEIDKLKAENQALKTQKSTVTAPTGKPKRDDFLDSVDPDEAYIDATLEWRQSQQASNQKQATQQANDQEVIKQLNESVDKHYDRAARLAKANKIEPAVYQQADASVRNALGEDITNAMIFKMGEGSEKVMFNLGRNPRKLAEIQASLAQDTSGLSAMMLLGKLSAELSPRKRRTNAPAPAGKVNSGSKGATSEKKAKADYDKAEKAGNVTKAFTLRRAAKKAGHNTRDW